MIGYYEKNYERRRSFEKDQAYRTLSSQTTTTTISHQPSFSHEKTELPFGRRNTIRETYSHNTYGDTNNNIQNIRDDREKNNHNNIMNSNSILSTNKNTYKQPVRLSPSIRTTQPSSINQHIGIDRHNSHNGHTNNHNNTLTSKPSIRGNISLSDPNHPAHHNNVFESLNNENLSSNEKTSRLLMLLRKVQGKQRHWTTGLCNCTSGKKRHLFWQCLLGPIYQGCQAERMGEDFFTGCCMGGLFGLPCTNLPWLSNGAMISLRTKLRERHNIMGAIFEDWVLYMCCLGNCASVQLYRELDELGYPGSWLG